MKTWRTGERVRYVGQKTAVLGCVGVVLGDGNPYPDDTTCFVRFDGIPERWSVPDASLVREDGSVPAIEPWSGL